MKYAKPLTATVLLTVILLLISIGLRIVTFETYRTIGATDPAPFGIEQQGATQRLAQALQYPTISPDSPDDWQPEPFHAFRAFLEQGWPDVHRQLEREIIAGHSLLYSWPGSDSELAPLLLMAHYDVVPVESDSQTNWTYPPFAGTVADGYIWGRGALDNKSGVTGLLEAVELLLAEGFEPRRTLFLAFGHDEEIGGFSGARKIAEQLEARGIELAAVIDEGGLIVPDSGLIGAPVALVGTAEKGYLSLRLSVEGGGGHSSQPPALTAAGRLARAIDRVQSSPFPARLEAPTHDMLRYTAAEAGLLQRMAIANEWLFRPLLLRTLAEDPATNAMIRTTIAPTMLRGSDKDNVLPLRAEGVINFRLLPGDTREDVIKHVSEAIADPEVDITALGTFGTDPSPVSPVDDSVFRTLAGTIRQIHPEAVVAPYLVVGATDSRHYQKLTSRVYRFMPFVVPAGDISGIHGTDERLAIDSYIDGIRLYRQLILNLDEARP